MLRFQGYRCDVQSIPRDIVRTNASTSLYTQSAVIKGKFVTVGGVETAKAFEYDDNDAPKSSFSFGIHCTIEILRARIFFFCVAVVVG